MNIKILIKSKAIRNKIVKGINYYSDGLHDLSGKLLKGSSLNRKKVVIVAKKHYKEEWKSFSSVSKKEIEQIINNKKLNKSGHVSLFQKFKNEKIDGYDLKVTSFDEKIEELSKSSLLLIPETELIKEFDSIPFSGEFETPKGTLYYGVLENKSFSSYQKGMIVSIASFKLGVGLPEDIPTLNLSRFQFFEKLIDAVFSVNLKYLFSNSYIPFSSLAKPLHLHLLYWGPLLTILMFYIGTNVYLGFKNYTLEQSINAYSSEVSETLNKKLAHDQKMVSFEHLSIELNKENQIHLYWSLIDTLLNADMTISRITYENGKFSIRGLAKKASDILNVASKHELVMSASFRGAVRKIRGEDSFILVVEPNIEAAKILNQSLLQKEKESSK